MAHTLMDNRHGLVSDFRLTEANGMAERDAALDMLIQIPGSRRLTIGSDRGYDSRDFAASLGSFLLISLLLRELGEHGQDQLAMRTG